MAKKLDMKKFWLLLSVVIVVMSLQNCAQENEDLTPLSEVKFWTQEELDKYKDRLLDVDQIQGDVYVTNAADLSAFENLKTISGKLRIQFTDLVNLDGLCNLEVVKGLKIDANPNLIFLELKNLKIVEENIGIIGNATLQEVKFPRLEKVGTIGEFGWKNGAINIGDNDDLLSVLLNSLKDYAGIGILRNDKFTSLMGLNNPPDSAFYWREILLDFATMDCPFDLFRHLNQASEFAISIKNVEESNFDWLANVKPGSALNFFGELSPEDLCVLEEIISDYPSLLKVYENDWTILTSFSGFEVLEQCQ